MVKRSTTWTQMSVLTLNFTCFYFVYLYLSNSTSFSITLVIVLISWTSFRLAIMNIINKILQKYLKNAKNEILIINTFFLSRNVFWSKKLNKMQFWNRSPFMNLKSVFQLIKHNKIFLFSVSKINTFSSKWSPMIWT